MVWTKINGWKLIELRLKTVEVQEKIDYHVKKSGGGKSWIVKKFKRVEKRWYIATCR